MKNGSRESINAAMKKKNEADASKREQYRQQQKEKFLNGRMNNWKYVTAINFVIAAIFLGLAIYRAINRANMLNIILLGVFGLLNLACAIWNIKRFKGTEGQVKEQG